MLEEIGRRQMKLTHILITHRHADHTGGVRELKTSTNCVVYAGAEKWLAGVDTALSDGETFEIGPLTVRCIATPGHTVNSVCYFLSGGTLSAPVLFTGDTLFVCGCGRLFEADGKTMLASLRKLAELPDETLVYPGHDYAEENLRFALIQKPRDRKLTARLDEVHKKMAQNAPTVPSTLGDEKRLNPFLSAPDAQAFIRLRKRKDVF